MLSFAPLVANLAIGLNISCKLLFVRFVLTSCIQPQMSAGPSVFKDFTSWLSPANLDFIQFSGVSCVVKFNYYEYACFSVSSLVLMFFFICPS